MPAEASPDFFFWTASFLVPASPSTVSVEGCQRTGLGEQRQAGPAGGKAGVLRSPCAPSTDFPSLLRCPSGRARAPRAEAGLAPERWQPQPEALPESWCGTGTGGAWRRRSWIRKCASPCEITEMWLLFTRASWTVLVVLTWVGGDQGCRWVLPSVPDGPAQTRSPTQVSVCEAQKARPNSPHPPPALSPSGQAGLWEVGLATRESSVCS